MVRSSFPVAPRKENQLVPFANPFATGLRCSFTANKYMKEEVTKQRVIIETKIRQTSGSREDERNSKEICKSQCTDSVNSFTFEDRFSKVKSQASRVNRHIRDEGIKYEMFGEVLQQEVKKHLKNRL